jgi:superfamily II DNA or RNA helicase
VSAEWGGRTPREWQVRAREALRKALKVSDAALVRACTGSGKSILIAEIVSGVLARGGAVVISVPSSDLVDQLARTVADRVGEAHVGRFYASQKQWDRDCVIVCLNSFPKLLSKRSVFSVWIADEAHKLESDTGRQARKALQAAKRVGLTATPFRADERGLLDWPGGECFTYTTKDAERDGVLVPMRIEFPPEVKTVNVAEVRKVSVDPLIAKWIPTKDGPGVVNAVTVEDAVQHATYLRSEGIKAEAIHSNQSKAERERLIRQLESGEIKALVHVNLLSEGVDLPWLRWMVLRRVVGVKAEEMGRPSVRFVQEIGRVLRSYPGKTHATFFDVHRQFLKWDLSPEATFADLDEAERAPEEESSDDGDSSSDRTIKARQIAIRKGPLFSLVEELFMEAKENRIIVKMYGDEFTPVTTQQMELAIRVFGIRREHVCEPLRGWLEIPEVWDQISEASMADVSALISVLYASITLTPKGVRAKAAK